MDEEELNSLKHTQALSEKIKGPEDDTAISTMLDYVNTIPRLALRFVILEALSEAVPPESLFENRLIEAFEKAIESVPEQAQVNVYRAAKLRVDDKDKRNTGFKQFLDAKIFLYENYSRPEIRKDLFDPKNGL